MKDGGVVLVLIVVADDDVAGSTRIAEDELLDSWRSEKGVNRRDLDNIEGEIYSSSLDISIQLVDFEKMERLMRGSRCVFLSRLYSSAVTVGEGKR